MRCSECQGPVKPDITFFGEQLPSSFFEAWEKMDDNESSDGGCDLMIVIGTALAVCPFNMSID